MAGAAFNDVKSLRLTQGASTITQQLARLSLLTPDKTLTRKLQEIILAALIEEQYGKDQILELYLNKVYFGSGLHGAEAAALGYFGKHASDLTVAESALLAGLVKAPSSYAPTANLDLAHQRSTLTPVEGFAHAGAGVLVSVPAVHLAAQYAERGDVSGEQLHDRF